MSDLVVVRDAQAARSSKEGQDDYIGADKLPCENKPAEKIRSTTEDDP